jgi:hypothetical protein
MTEPEPVAYIKQREIGYMAATKSVGVTSWQTNLGLVPEPDDVPLYLAPPQREWRGLTRGDADSLRVSYTKNGFVQVDALLMRVDEMLRERNT